MTWQESLLSNMLTITILLVLALIVYLKAANKTLVEFFLELKEIFSSGGEQVQESVQGGFDRII